MSHMTTTDPQQPRRKKDIGENGIDAEVHGMASANNMVSPISNWRPDEPYDYNGSAEKGWGDGTLAQKFKDIGKDEVRPDVYTVVWNLIDPAPMPRAKHAPLEFEHPWDEVEHILKMREIAAMNYVDREDAAIKHLREQIAKAEAAAAAKEDEDDKALAKADKKTEAKDAKKTNEPKKDEAKKTTETEKPAKKEEKAAPAKKEEKTEPAKAVAQTPAKPAAPATKTEAPKSEAALAKKDEKAAPAKEEKKATPAKEEKKAEPAKAAAQTPAKKADAPKKAEAPKPAP